MPDVLATLQKLPPKAYSVLLSDPCLVIGLKRGERGYVPLRRERTPEAAKKRADRLNDGCATKAQVAAMEIGSCFGWEVPAADPDSYDANGLPL